MNRSMLNHEEAKKNCICRVCLKYNSEKLNDRVITVFENYNNKLICDKINDIVNIDIKEGDGLPDKICFSCVQSLETAYEFKQKCEHSNNILRSTIRARVVLYEHLIEEPVKEEAHSNYDENPISLEESIYDDDINLEYKLTELNFEVKQESDFEPKDDDSLQIKSFKSRAIDLNLECHDCGQFFKSKCKLRVHWKKEHMPAQLICPSCKKTFRTYKSLHSHIKQKKKQCIFASKIKIVGVGKTRIYHCPDCDYKTGRLQSMYSHSALHTGEKLFACEICGKAFTQSSGLFNHRSSVHKLKIKEGTCQYCGKHLVGRSKLYRHVKAHTEIPYPCQLCNKVLKSKNILQMHMKRHSGVKSYTCEICAKTFYTMSDLCNHREKAHIKSKLFKCDRCKYETRLYNCMRKHTKKHTDTNVACDICGMFVDNEQQLALHKLRHNKDSECMYCHKMFYRQKNLNAHMRIKHNVKNNNKSILLVKTE